MLIYTARIDSREYFLTSAEEADELKKSVLTAIRAGGDFIEARTSGSRTASILVTGYTPVVFEVHESVEMATHVEPPLTPFEDFDHP